MSATLVQKYMAFQQKGWLLHIPDLDALALVFRGTGTCDPFCDNHLTCCIFNLCVHSVLSVVTNIDNIKNDIIVTHKEFVLQNLSGSVSHGFLNRCEIADLLLRR